MRSTRGISHRKTATESPYNTRGQTSSATGTARKHNSNNGMWPWAKMTGDMSSKGKHTLSRVQGQNVPQQNLLLYFGVSQGKSSCQGLKVLAWMSRDPFIVVLLVVVRIKLCHASHAVNSIFRLFVRSLRLRCGSTSTSEDNQHCACCRHVTVCPVVYAVLIYTDTAILYA